MVKYNIEEIPNYDHYFRFTDEFSHFDILKINLLLNILGCTKALEQAIIVSCYFKGSNNQFQVNGMAYEQPINKTFYGIIKFKKNNRILINLNVTLLKNNQERKYLTTLILNEEQIKRMTTYSLGRELVVYIPNILKNEEEYENRNSYCQL